MAQLNIITFTKAEFQTVGRELGERLTPYFAPPSKIDVIRTDLIGQSGSGKSTFQQAMAQPMMYGAAIQSPSNYNEQMAYSFEARTPSGRMRQAIFVDVHGLDYIPENRDIPDRTASGPLFVQHPECVSTLSEANAAKLEVATQVKVSLIKYRDDEFSITMNVDIPNFPMNRLVDRLTKLDIITPPRRQLNWQGFNR